MGGNSLALSGEAEVFFRGGFDTDLIYIHLHHSRQVLPHRLAVGGQLRRLGDNGGINIHDFIVLFR